MNNEHWSFSDFVRWLRAKSETLRGLGATVEFQINDTARASVRLRIEHGQNLGELIAWDDGAAQMSVLDLASGDFVFERDGVSLSGAASSSELNEFFERLDTGV
jgi:hypothetical protein